MKTTTPLRSLSPSKSSCFTVTRMLSSLPRWYNRTSKILAASDKMPVLSEPKICPIFLMHHSTEAASLIRGEFLTSTSSTSTIHAIQCHSKQLYTTPKYTPRPNMLGKLQKQLQGHQQPNLGPHLKKRVFLRLQRTVVPQEHSPFPDNIIRALNKDEL